jgi:hypothetical protein
MIIENNMLRKGVGTKTEEADNEKLASRCPVITVIISRRKRRA